MKWRLGAVMEDFGTMTAHTEQGAENPAKPTKWESTLSVLGAGLGLALVFSLFQGFSERGQVQGKLASVIAASTPAPVGVGVPAPTDQSANLSVDTMVGTILAEWKQENGLKHKRVTLLDHLDGFQAERKCLSEAIYYEAGRESYSGRLAVAQVVLNRVSDEFYPDTICEVVYQGPLHGRKGEMGCQFTFTCDGAMNRRLNEDMWAESEALAKVAMMGIAGKLTDEATHYHATYVNPYWASSLIKTVQIGTHIFYRNAS